MSRRTFLAAATAATAVLCASAVIPAMLPTRASAQANPTMTNVIPEGGSYSVRGKVEAIDPAARTLTIMPESNTPLPMTAAPGVDLGDIEAGDTVSAHYSRAVAFLIASPQAQPPPRGATGTVDQAARTPGGIGPQATQLTGAVTKLNSANSFDVVDAGGGGVYTVRVTDPARVALVRQLKVGDTVTVSVGPLVLTSIAKCGWFGLGC
jgi:hypothetical protein